MNRRAACVASHNNCGGMPDGIKSPSAGIASSIFRRANESGSHPISKPSNRQQIYLSFHTTGAEPRTYSELRKSAARAFRCQDRAARGKPVRNDEAEEYLLSLDLSRGSRVGLSSFGFGVETVDAVCIHGRLPDTVG